MKANLSRRTLRREAVIHKTGLGRTTIHHLEKSGEFPKHFLLTPRCAVWFEDEIDAWLEERSKSAIKAAHGPDVRLRKTARGRPASGVGRSAAELLRANGG